MWSDKFCAILLVDILQLYIQLQNNILGKNDTKKMYQ